MHLNIFASPKCFLNCKGCYSFSRTEKNHQIISTEIITNFLNYAYQKGARKVTLCGGDPLAREDIIELLRKIKGIGYNISLDTVGTPLIKDIVINGKIIIKKMSAKELSELVDTIGIPIDGSTNDIFKRFRQTKNNILEEQIKICEELHKYGGNVCINTVVHKGNINDAEELSNMINKLDFIGKWQLFEYAPLGKYGVLNKKLFEISDEEFNDYKNKILKTFKDLKKIEFKEFKTRNHSYILIDNSGNAWIPTYDKNNLEEYINHSERRKLIGNIKKNEDWDKICKALIETS